MRFLQSVHMFKYRDKLCVYEIDSSKLLAQCVRTFAYFFRIKNGSALRNIQLHFHGLGNLGAVVILVQYGANTHQQPEVRFGISNARRNLARAGQQLALGLHVGTAVIGHCIVQHQRRARDLYVFVERAAGDVDNRRQHVVLVRLHQLLASRTVEHIRQRAQRQHLIGRRLRVGQKLEHVTQKLRAVLAAAEMLVDFLVTDGQT